MKLLFIAVSVVALMYLLLQSSLISDFSPANSANESVNTAQNKTGGHVASSQQLEARVAELTASNQRLQLQLDELAQQLVTMQTGAAIAAVEQNETPQSASLASSMEPMPVQQPADTFNTASATNKPQDEQQRRLQQQAVLRDLAQKMELAALAGLSS